MASKYCLPDSAEAPHVHYGCIDEASTVEGVRDIITKLKNSQNPDEVVIKVEIVKSCLNILPA